MIERKNMDRSGGLPGFIDAVLEEPDIPVQAPADRVPRVRRRSSFPRRAAVVLSAGLAAGLAALGPDTPVTRHTATAAVVQTALPARGFQEIALGAQRVEVDTDAVPPAPEMGAVHTVFAEPTINPNVAEREDRLDERGTGEYGLNSVVLPADFAQRSELTGGAVVLLPPGRVAVRGDVVASLRQDPESDRTRLTLEAPETQESSPQPPVLVEVFPES